MLGTEVYVPQPRPVQYLRVQLDVRSFFQDNNIIASFHGEQSQIKILQSFWIVGGKNSFIDPSPSAPPHPICTPTQTQLTTIYWLTFTKWA